MIREICINLRVSCEPATFAGINFTFLEILASLKLVNYTKISLVFSFEAKVIKCCRCYAELTWFNMAAFMKLNPS